MCISPYYTAANKTCFLSSISMLILLCKRRLKKWASVYDRISNYSLVLTVWNRWITTPLYTLNRFNGGKYHDAIFFLAFLAWNEHWITDIISAVSPTWETMSLSNVILPQKRVQKQNADTLCREKRLPSWLPSFIPCPAHKKIYLLLIQYIIIYNRIWTNRMSQSFPYYPEFPNQKVFYLCNKSHCFQLNLSVFLNQHWL